MSFTRVIAITGCDSGLGWALAARSAREGLLTVAGMYQGIDTKAAQALRKLRAHPYSLDVTSPESISAFHDYVASMLKENPSYKLHAVVNNAGVMTIGNYEWLTPTLIENMINVNLLGPMRVAAAFLPDLRKYALDNASSTKPRIINVGSHCGLHPMPGFSAYCASKAGLIAWTRALRLEHRAHGLSVVTFVPGGFSASSGIMSQQNISGNEMIKHLNEEQKAMFGHEITVLNNYLQASTSGPKFDSLKDENIVETFMQALMEDNPKALYKVESWRYMFYYNLLKLPLPEILHHWLIRKFLMFPTHS